MSLTTAVVWFIVAGAPMNHHYLLGSLGPFANQERCETHRKHLSKYMDAGYFGVPFVDRTQCLPMEIVIGAAQAQKDK